MKFLFDQNISHRILKFLPDLFEGSSTVKKEKLIDCSDRQIREFAKMNGFIIVTQDSDFNDLNSLFGFPPKIIWIRSGNLKTEQISNILEKYHAEIIKFIKDENFGCFEIIALQK